MPTRKRRWLKQRLDTPPDAMARARQTAWAWPILLDDARVADRRPEAPVSALPAGRPVAADAQPVSAPPIQTDLRALQAPMAPPDDRLDPAQPSRVTGASTPDALRLPDASGSQPVSEQPLPSAPPQSTAPEQLAMRAPSREIQLRLREDRPPRQIDPIVQGAPGASALPFANRATQRAVVTGDRVFLRTAPALNAEPLAQYDTGASALITEERGDWRRVVIEGQTGWMFFDYLTPSDIETRP